MLSLLLSGCASAQPFTRDTLETAGECVSRKALECIELTAQKCAEYATPREQFQCAQSFYPGCVLALSAQCAHGVWSPSSTTVGPSPELTP